MNNFRNTDMNMETIGLPITVITYQKENLNIVTGDYSRLAVLILVLRAGSSILQFVGYITPYWACSPSPCELDGLFYTCTNGSCEKKSLDNAIMALDTIVFISNFLHVVVMVITLNKYSFILEVIPRKESVGIGIWAGINDILSIVGLSLVYTRFQRVGWSANLFTGTAASFCIVDAFALWECLLGKLWDRISGKLRERISGKLRERISGTYNKIAPR